MLKDKDDILLGNKINNYTFIEVIGQGSWGKIYLIYDEQQKRNIACKTISKQKINLNPYFASLIQNQISILKKCNNDNIVKYINSIQNQNNFFIFMEYCNGGDLEQYIYKNKYLKEKEAIIFLKHILNGFKGLHQVGAMHRDFKSANILLNNGVAKIADLGFAKVIEGDTHTKTILGTRNTMAPELLSRKSYGFEADIWSLGVVYYQMLYGQYPYLSMNEHQLLKKMKVPPKFPNDFGISQNSKNFILQCLKFDPLQRISWLKIYEHDIIKINFVQRNRISNIKIQSNITENKQFYKNNTLTIIQESYSFKQVTSEYLNEQIQQQSRFENLKIEVERIKQRQQIIMNYAEKYLEKRNKPMMILKYCFYPFLELSRLQINPNMYAFLICKLIFFQIKQLKYDLENNVNIFKLDAYFNDFLDSIQYKDIKCKVNQDYQKIEINALFYMTQVKTSNKQIQHELNLDSCSANFKTLVKHHLKIYLQLVQNQKYNHKQTKKDILNRFIIALKYFVQGIQFNSVEFEEKLQDSLTYSHINLLN